MGSQPAGLSAASTLVVPLIGMIANAILVIGSYRLARRALGRRRGLAPVLATALIFWTAATIGLELLGTIGLIGAEPILGWSVAVAAIGWVVGRAPAAKSPPEPDHAGSPAGWEATVALGLVLASGLVFLIPSLLSAVKVVSDGPIYHLYFAARWWKAGRLILVAAPFGENAATYFPANGDLWFTWLIGSWGGDRLARVGQVPFLPMAAAAAYGCARLLGIGRTSGGVAACCFVSSMPLFLFSFEPNVDTIFVAGYLTAAYFFLRYAREGGGTPVIVLGALAAGLALGTKPTAIVFVVPLLAVVAVDVFVRSEGRDRLIRPAIVAIGPLVTCGYWYARDLWLTGSPLYPLDVRLLGWTLWPGWYGPVAMRHSPYYLPVGEVGALADTVAAILDPRMAPLWLAAIAGGWALNNPATRGSRRWIALFAIGAVLNVALYWLVIPYRTQQRFMLQALGLGVVPLAATLDRGRWLRIVATVLLGLHVLTPETWPWPAREDAIPWDCSRLVPNAIGSLLPLFPRIEPSRSIGASLPVHPVVLALVVVAVLMVGAWRRALAGGPPDSRGRRVVLAAVSTLAFVGLGFADVGGRALEPMFRFYPPFRDFYAGWRAFDAACGPRGARVAYAGTNIPYYLLGAGLRNEVRYVNVSAERDWLMHDYHRRALASGSGQWPNSRPGWDRIQPDYRAWLEHLDADGIQLLVVTRVNPAEGEHNVADAEGFPIERVWADRHPDRFALLYGQNPPDPWFRLYRVIRPRSAR